MHDWAERAERWQGIRTEWLTVNHLPVHTLRADGPDDGTPIVLVHGLGGSATNWLEVMPALARRGPVLAMDLPGFGMTAPPRPSAAAVRPNARFISALCREVGWDRVVLMGNSMGGMIAVLVAGHRQDLVESLVLVNPGLPAPLRAALEVPVTALAVFAPFVLPGLGSRLMKARLNRLSAEDLFRETMNLVTADRSRVSEELKQVGLDNTRRGKELDWRPASFGHAAESLMSLLIGPSRRVAHRSLDAITAPTLLLWGDKDRLVGEPVVDGVAQRRPDWHVHVWEDVGHVPMMEVPERFSAVVTDWLDQSQPVPA